MNKEEKRLRANEVGRASYWRNREKHLEKSRQYRELPGYKERERSRTLARKLLVLTHYGNGECACLNCGFSNIKALSIDHINGRRAVGHNKKGMGGNSIYSWLIKEGYPEGYQTLCLNCQFVKREERHEFGNQYTNR